MRSWTLFAGIAVAAASLGQAAQAAPEREEPNWVKSIDTSNEEATDYVDVNSIKRKGDIAQIRIRSVFFEGKSSLREGEGVLEVNCRTNMARLLSMNLISNDGKPINVDRPGQWTQIVARSPADNAAQFACREEPQPVPATPKG